MAIFIEYPAAATQYSIAENVLNNCEPPAVTAENGGGYKERIRRMKINASYLALRALIPDYSISRSKERWTAPALVDCVLKYIPELENEIETLKLKKQNYLIQADESTGINSPDQNSQQTGIDSITVLTLNLHTSK
ncbi:transcription factor bHLH160-like [Olea europaea subsp. europaea]|uniref:Transcription factor bHLH160-like n=1 Tax=Olea europaea subsp. europaea TaxID=158383 RepID=A0A8S0QB05_OLEEU|nr:transcription factor bHLH160-like [Olea europaea subsp. europaea]